MYLFQVKKNQEIRDALDAYGLKQYELAKMLHISECWLCRKLRDELPEDEKEKILELIKSTRKH